MHGTKPVQLIGTILLCRFLFTTYYANWELVLCRKIGGQVLKVGVCHDLRTHGPTGTMSSSLLRIPRKEAHVACRPPDAGFGTRRIR